MKNTALVNMISFLKFLFLITKNNMAAKSAYSKNVNDE